MAILRSLPCCGVAEVCRIKDRTNPKTAIAQAKAGRFGMLLVYFVKYRGNKKFEAAKAIAAFEKAGFKKQRKFVNPNSGNTIQPMYYILPRKERDPNGLGRHDAQFIDF